MRSAPSGHVLILVATLVALVVACDQGSVTATRTAEQAVTCDGRLPVEDISAVHAGGTPGAPTHERLDQLPLVSPPVGTDPPTAGAAIMVSQAVLDTLPEGGVEEAARPGGSRVGCVVDWNKWTCWVRFNGRTYYCEGTSTWV